MATKKIYALIDQEGNLSYETYFLIRNNLPEEDRKYIAKILIEGVLPDINQSRNLIVMFDNEKVAVYFIPVWIEKCRRERYDNIWFENQSIHDLDVESKILSQKNLL